MMTRYHPSKINWYNPNVEYIFDYDICEYDMKDAGMSIIVNHKLLDDDTIHSLMGSSKKERNVAVGKIRGKDKVFSSIFSEKFTEMRQLFISTNSLKDDDIICVKNDAIYTIGTCQYTSFNGIEFVLKNSYSSYIRFTENSDIEIFYRNNSSDVKGINESNINKHRLYIMEYINKTISMIESKNQSVKRHTRLFVDKYKTLKMDEGYYLEFNNMSQTINPIFNYQKVIIPLVQIIMKEIR